MCTVCVFYILVNPTLGHRESGHRDTPGAGAVCRMYVWNVMHQSHTWATHRISHHIQMVGPATRQKTKDQNMAVYPCIHEPLKYIVMLFLYLDCCCHYLTTPFWMASRFIFTYSLQLIELYSMTSLKDISDDYL